MLYKNYIHYTKLSDLWCEYMEYMRSVICLLGYEIYFYILLNLTVISD